MPVPTTDLLSRARSGDVGAFEELVREHAAMVYRVALRVVGNPYDAQDVCQKALLSAWQGLARFRGDAAFSTWLHLIVRRHALNHISRGGRAVWSGEIDDRPDPRSGPAETAIRSDDVECLHAAVAALPDSQEQVIRMYHFDDLSYAQIAAATASTEPAVRSRLFRARRSLADTLADRR